MIQKILSIKPHFFQWRVNLYLPLRRCRKERHQAATRMACHYGKTKPPLHKDAGLETGGLA